MFACVDAAPRNTIWLRTRAEDYVSLLVSCHKDFRDGDGSNRDAMHTLAHFLYNVRQIYEAKDSLPQPWELLLDHDIIPTLVDLLSDFDFDADIERHGLNIVRDHLSDLLAMLAASLEYLFDSHKHAEHKTDLDPADCPRCAVVARALESVTSLGPAVLENIWNHRTPLFDTDREGMFRKDCNMNPEWHGLHGTVCAIASQLVCYSIEDPEFRTRFGPTMVQAAKLCLFVWLYSVRKPQRETSVENIQLGLSYEVKSGNLFYNTWYLGVTQSDVAPSQISKAFLRDFKDQDVVGEELARRIILLDSFRKQVAYVPLYYPEELSMYWSVLAARRRDRCSHTNNPHDPTLDMNPEERVFQYILQALASSIKWHQNQTNPGERLIPLAYIHASIPLISDTLLDRMSDEVSQIYGDKYMKELHGCLGHCVWLLVQHRERPEVDTAAGFARPSPDMRRLSLEYWQRANILLTTQDYRTKARWRTIYNVWKLLGDALERGEAALKSSESDVQHNVLGPTKRCAWNECLCSAYKPTHDLKLCKGCWAVAYCNRKCQASDWENHRNTCAQGRRDALDA